MALSITTLTDGSSATTASSYNTASVAPTANDLILVAVLGLTLSSNDVSPTLSGGGMTTWTRITHANNGGNMCLDLFRALQAAPSSGVITITIPADSYTECIWSVYDVGGCKTSGSNGADAIVQAPAAVLNASSTSNTVTLSALASSANAAFATMGIHSTAAVTGETGTLESDVSSTTTRRSDVYGVNVTSPSVTWGGASTNYGIAVEISVGAGLPQAPHMYLARTAANF